MDRKFTFMHLFAHKIAFACALLLSFVSHAQINQVQPRPNIRFFLNPTAATNAPGVVIMKGTNLPSTGLIRLRNGDALQGKLLAIDTQKQIQWENPHIRPAMQIFGSNVTQMRLVPNPPAQRNPDPNCVLKLLNGDQFTGRLVSMDSKQLLLNTWYAGQLKFPRPQVRWIRSMQGGGVVFQGPTGLDGWTVSASAELADDKVPAWAYSRGAFYGRKAGGIARDVKLPDRSAIDFDLAWKQFIQLTITVYTDTMQVYRLPGFVGMGFGAGGQVLMNNQGLTTNPQAGAGFYAIHLNQLMGGAYLMTVRKNGEIHTSATEPIPDLAQKTRAHVSIRVDKMQKTISLLLDGKLVKTWQEGADFAGAGTGIRFVQQGYAPMMLSHLEIGPWDGVIEETLEMASRGTNDFFQLKNQDSFSASLQHIRDGTLAVKTSFGMINLPLERLSEVDLAPEQGVVPAVDAGAVRAWFADGGSASFRIEQWDHQKVVAISPVFGRAEFNPNSFSFLDFVPPKTARAESHP